jgi:hypothetical protein
MSWLMKTSADLIASEAARWLYGHDFLKVQLDHGLKSFSCGALTCGFGQRLEPTRVLRPKRDQPSDCIIPALRQGVIPRQPTRHGLT